MAFGNGRLSLARKDLGLDGLTGRSRRRFVPHRCEERRGRGDGGPAAGGRRLAYPVPSPRSVVSDARDHLWPVGHCCCCAERAEWSARQRAERRRAGGRRRRPREPFRLQRSRWLSPSMRWAGLGAQGGSATESNPCEGSAVRPGRGGEVEGRGNFEKGLSSAVEQKWWCGCRAGARPVRPASQRNRERLALFFSRPVAQRLER